MELHPTSSPRLFPCRTNHHLWSDPSPMIGGDKPAPAPQEKGGGFLAAKRVPPATYLSLSPSSFLEPLPLN